MNDKVSSSADFGLAGKVAIVTGATGGIGRAVANGFASAGAHVVVVDVDSSKCEEVAQSLPGEHMPCGVDLRDLSAHQAIIDGAANHFGRLDNLTCLAAVLRRRADIFSVTEDDWDFQHDVNVKSTFFLNREFARVMIDRDELGSIVNFTSQGWWTGGFGGSVAYAATKGGVVSMSRGLARTLAPAIRVNTVAPGAVDTPMMRSGMTDADLEEFVQMIPMKRMAFPDDLVGAVLFLASDLARYITGATLNVSGGQLMY